jgi:GT2 family glycosyltransferase
MPVDLKDSGNASSCEGVSTEPADSIELSVLIVGYNSRHYLEACIRGACESMAGVRGEILFHNCSTDGSEALVSEKFPTVRIIPSGGNLGFARANNLLARNARGTHLLLLNPDTIPIDGCVGRILRLAQETKGAGIAGGRTVLPCGGVDFGSHQPMITPFTIWLGALGLTALDRRVLPAGPGGPRRVDVVSGAFLCISREAWEQVGGFDPGLFMYAEEVDLCKRVAANGWLVVGDPRIVVLHDAKSGNRFSGDRRIQVLRGKVTFVRKHYAPLLASLATAGFVVQEIRRFLVGWAIGVVFRSESRRKAAMQSLHCLKRVSQWWNGWQAETVGPCPQET